MPAAVPDPVPAIGVWQTATVLAIRPETSRVKTFRLRLEQPLRHMAGQHYLVRLTAPDGYRAQRSYSVASPPEDDGEIELTVERLPDGEVSTFLHDEVVVGDTLDLRGPLGGWFVWDGARPALLIGGGSGIVPLMAMLRLARRTPAQLLARLVVSVRTPDELIYAAELSEPDTSVLYTRATPPGFARRPRRIAVEDIEPFLHPNTTTTYICGSSAFAEAASTLMVDTGVDPATIRIERFGPTG
jgi:ferredoxin-NADP reductase